MYDGENVMIENKMSPLSLGIDVGSTTVKVVLLEGDKILYREYQRHMSQVRQKTLELLHQAASFIGDRGRERRGDRRVGG